MGGQGCPAAWWGAVGWPLVGRNHSGGRWRISQPLPVELGQFIAQPPIGQPFGRHLATHGADLVPQKMIFSEVDLTIQNGETVVKTVNSQALLQRFVSSAAQVAFLNSCDLGLVLEIEQAETEPLAPPPIEEPKPEVKPKAKKTEAV